MAADRRRSAFAPHPSDRRFEIVSGKSFSAAHAWSPQPQAMIQVPPGRAKAAKKSSSAARRWGLSDPEMKRRRRVAGYKVYAVEGRVKESIRRGFRWFKDKCSNFVHGW